MVVIQKLPGDTGTGRGRIEWGHGQGGQTPPATNTELTDSFTWDSEGGSGLAHSSKSAKSTLEIKSMGTTAKLPLNQKYRHILFSGEFWDLAQRLVITSQAWKS